VTTMTHNVTDRYILERMHPNFGGGRGPWYLLFEDLPSDLNLDFQQLSRRLQDWTAARLLEAKVGYPGRRADSTDERPFVGYDLTGLGLVFVRRQIETPGPFCAFCNNLLTPSTSSGSWQCYYCGLVKPD
jgi:hypothetical protein